MRKKIFGAFAAMAVGAGAVSAQTPFPPYGGNAGSPYTNQPIPAMIPGGPNGAVLPQLNPGPGMIPPGADPAQMLPPNHQPVYPPPGPYAQTMYESPYTGGYGGGPGMEGGIPGPVAPRVWFKGDYLLMFLKPMPSNATLISTGLANPGGASDNGVLGQPTTVPLFGQNNYEFNAVSGFRLEGGFWGTADQRLGASVSAIYIAPSSVGFGAASAANGSPLLGRPIFNNNPNTVTVNGTAGGNDIALVANPGVGSGNIFAQVTSRLFGIDANALLNLYRAEPGCGGLAGWNLNFLTGYRYMELQESILVQSNTLLLAAVSYNNIVLPAGSNVGVQDSFSTLNRFNAGQVGLEASTQQGRWAFGMTGKAAFGVNTQRTVIQGGTTDYGANNFVGGVYANSSNIGTYISNKFAIGVDANATVGYMFTPRFMGTVGYNYVFLNNVVRAGNSLSQTVDPMTAPGYGSGGGVVPSVGSGAPNLMNDTFWMHGVNFGFSLTF
jgi:hypothetical protein